MAKVVISEDQRATLRQYLEENSAVGLVSAYLFFVEKKLQINPVLFVRDRIIYRSAEDLIKRLEEKKELWNETEIKIGFETPAVNEETKKIYICPFTGKVFGDNTHPNPQDAIYDWVSKCPENKERIGGLKVKRFFVSEDPDVIKNYLEKSKPKKEPITKVVYSSGMSGKLFNTKESVIKDFKKGYLKPLALPEVPNQNRFQIEDSFLAFIQDQLGEDKVANFVESLSEYEEFAPFIQFWLGNEEE